MKRYLFLMAILYSFQSLSIDYGSIDINNRLICIAKKFIIENYVDSTDVFSLKPIIVDHGDSWEVTFQLLDLTIGGIPVIFISKDTFEVVDAYHTQ